MADRKNVEDLEFLEVEDIEEASENIRTKLWTRMSHSFRDEEVEFRNLF